MQSLAHAACRSGRLSLGVVDTPTEIPGEFKSHLDNDIGYQLRVNPINFERPDDQELYCGLIRIHILYHACGGPIFGLGTKAWF